MNRLVLRSHAKVNFTLDVLSRRSEDGYHLIRSVMLPIDLSDSITIVPAPMISVTCTPDLHVPNEENLAFRAAHLLMEVANYRGGAAIRIQKRIPVAGGLAGGSSNAASVLAGLNQLWGLSWGQSELRDLAIRLGSDVPFCLLGQPARVEGVGERLAPLLVRNPMWLVVATPDVPKSTANVYRLFDELVQVERPDSARMEEALAHGDLRAISSLLGNVFEQVMFPRHPEIAALKAAMLEGGAVGAVMSGAGPSVFGIVRDETAGLRLLAAVRPLVRRTVLVRTVTW